MSAKDRETVEQAAGSVMRANVDAFAQLVTVDPEDAAIGMLRAVEAHVGGPVTPSTIRHVADYYSKVVEALYRIASAREIAALRLTAEEKPS